MKQQKQLSYTVLLEHNEDGGYTITVPALPGLVTEARDLNDAQLQAQEAIECYLEGLKDGESVPIEGDLSQLRVNIALHA